MAGPESVGSSDGPVSKPEMKRRSARWERSSALCIPTRRPGRQDARPPATKIASSDHPMIANPAFSASSTQFCKRVALNFEAMRFSRDRPPDFDIPGGMREIVDVVAALALTRVLESLLFGVSQPIRWFSRPSRFCWPPLRRALVVFPRGEPHGSIRSPPCGVNEYPIPSARRPGGSGLNKATVVF